MNTIRQLLPALSAVAILGASVDAARAQEAGAGETTSDQVVPAHVHIRHVAEAFRGTPDGLGLLPTTVAEADIAHQHATLAARDPSDLESIQRHAAHVLHALDPSEVESGPGLGYGMIEAGNRTVHYVDLAMASEGAGDAIQTHGPHVLTATQGAVDLAEEARGVAGDIADAETAEEATALLERLTELTDAMVNGVDANGDGRIGWQTGEGGLAQATQHLGLLMRGEGLGG